MIYDIQQNVIDFHNKFGHPVRDTPQEIESDEAYLALGFIEEEANELRDAIEAWKEFCECCGSEPTYDPNLVEIADALGDIVVTSYGMAIRHGIDLNAVLQEIMSSNMTKEANGLGKIKKGADYRPPNIAQVLGV